MQQASIIILYILYLYCIFYFSTQYCYLTRGHSKDWKFLLSTKGSTAGGLIIYEKSDFVYFHHGRDPVSGKRCNAFDIVRLHKFGALDDETKEGTPMNKRPSFKSTQELAMKDNEVKRKIAQDHISEASEDFSVVSMLLPVLG